MNWSRPAPRHPRVRGAGRALAKRERMAFGAENPANTANGGAGGAASLRQLADGFDGQGLHNVRLADAVELTIQNTAHVIDEALRIGQKLWVELVPVG